MKNRKKIGSIISVIIIASAFLITMVPIQVTATTDPNDWYTSVEGVLDSDYYWLYPFEKNSLTIGFSKFGELINSTGNVGLEYGSVDPFAPPAGSGTTSSVPKVMWVQGWLINITYQHVTKGTRNVWACALFSDTTNYGGDWIRVDFQNDYSATYGWEDPLDPGYYIGASDYGTTLVYGGRKTNGTAVTQPIKVLYNGPRRFVALLNTTIYDHLVYLSDDTETDLPLVRILITIIFDKVKKTVILLKDIKSLLHEKYGQYMDIQFSDRGEVDLGTEAAGYSSYAHFYTQGRCDHNSDGDYTDPGDDNEQAGQSTVYNSAWEIIQTLSPSTITAAGPYPQATLPTYDVAQAVNPTAGYVWFAAFWPSLSDWSIDGWNHSHKSLEASDPHYIDDSGTEPAIPFYIGEWDFRLYYNTDPNRRTQFRGVTVYGVINHHNADDANGSDLNNDGQTENELDVEVEYLLDQIFNPWDLYDAVHKDTRRWVDFYTVTEIDVLNAANNHQNLNITLSHRPVRKTTYWETYCAFSERVEWNGALKYPHRAIYTPYTSAPTYDYKLYVLNNGTGIIEIPWQKVPSAGTRIKILYSTNCTISYTETEIANYYGGRLSIGNASLTATNNTKVVIVPNPSINSTAWTDPLEIVQNITILYDEYIFVIHGSPDQPSTVLTGVDYLNITIDIKIPPEGGYITVHNSTYFVASVTKGSTYNVTMSGNMSIMYKVNPPNSLTTNEHEYVHITGTISIAANHTLYRTERGEYTIIANYTIADANLTKSIMGRYEWAIVGRDSRAVDSAGAAMVTAAFKDKQIELGLSGLEMQDTSYGSYIPWIARNLTGTSDARTNYNDALGREALKDDWCNTWPISSSNIIAVGGPAANLITEYFNEFTEAFMVDPSLSDYFTTYGILPLTCWNKIGNFVEGNTISDPYGYAVIATFKDLNGTVGFLVWGWTGQDTYYICKFFHEEIIWELQNFPYGVTSLIVRIDYSSDPEHPTFTIQECLGTISERLVETSKGGLHPDP